MIKRVGKMTNHRADTYIVAYSPQLLDNASKFERYKRISNEDPQEVVVTYQMKEYVAAHPGSDAIKLITDHCEKNGAKTARLSDNLIVYPVNDGSLSVDRNAYIGDVVSKAFHE